MCPGEARGRYRCGELGRNTRLTLRLAIQADGSGIIFGASSLPEIGMKKTLSDARARQELLARLERLRPDAKALWGRMTAPQMLAHVADWMLMAKGELKAAPKNVPLRYPVIKQLVIYWLPFPKGVPTAPELLSRKPATWAIEHAALRKHLESYGTMDPRGSVDHPAFGKMTTKMWDVLAYRHTDHHFRQFGV